MRQRESENGLLLKLRTKISAVNLRYLSMCTQSYLPVLPDKNLYHKTFVGEMHGGYVLVVCLLCWRVLYFDFSTQEEAMKDEEYHRLFVDVINRSLLHILLFLFTYGFSCEWPYNFLDAVFLYVCHDSLNCMSCSCARHWHRCKGFGKLWR